MKAFVCDLRFLLGALLSAGFGLGCSSNGPERVASTGVGNPYDDPETGTLALALVADNEQMASDQAALSEAGLEQATLVLGSVTWLPCEGGDPSVVQEGPFVVDLLSGTTEPELPVFAVPDGGMCGFDAALAPARDSAALGARSLYFAGTRADGVQFVLFADVAATLRVRAIGSVTWGATENLRLLWAMRPRRWATPVELDMSEPRVWAGGRRRTIVIDADRHPLLLSRIRSRLASESSLASDSDADRVLGDGERAAEVIGTGSTETED